MSAALVAYIITLFLSPVKGQFFILAKVLHFGGNYGIICAAGYFLCINILSGKAHSFAGRYNAPIPTGAAEKAVFLSLP